MNSIYRNAERSGRWGVCVGIVGAGMSAAMIGMMGAAAAHGDTTDGPVPVVPVTPESLLSSSADNLTDANALLGDADVPSEFEGVLGAQTEVLDNGLNVVSDYEGIQAPLLSSDDTSLVNLGDALFLADDQQIEQASADVLSAAQAFDTTPSVDTEFDLFLADAQLGGAALDTLIPNTLAGFADQLFGLGSEAADSAASLTDSFALF